MEVEWKIDRFKELANLSLSQSQVGVDTAASADSVSTEAMQP